MKKILFLISDTGGGHRANANALKDAFSSFYPDQFEFEIIDVLKDYSFWPFSKAPEIYSYLSIKKPFLWKMLFTTAKAPSFTRKLADFVGFFTYKKLYKKIVEYNPDLLVSIHPLVQELTVHSLKRIKRKIPFIVVATDLDTSHPLWFHKDLDMVFVPCEAVVNTAQSAGVIRDKIILSGLPVRQMFTQTYPSKTELRASVGLNPDLPTVMIIGGGDGVGPVYDTVVTLGRIPQGNGSPMAQLIVITGKNKSLYERLSSQKFDIPVKVTGFVENIAEYMFASDCIVTKAGPGTIAEALVCGLPIILFGFIPGQEEGNITYVVNNGSGVFEKNPQKIAELIQGWLTTDHIKFEQYQSASKKLGKPNSSEEIVKTIYSRFFKDRSI